MHQHDIVRMAAHCLDVLKRRGIELDAGQDISEFTRRMREAEKPDAHPMLSPSWHDFTSGDFMSLTFVRDGVDIGGVAARFIDLGQEPLSDYWARTYTRLYGVDQSPVMDMAPLIQREICGRIVYLGEFYIKKGARGEPGVSAVILRYLQCIVALTWRPEWIYGFVRAEDAERGKAVQYGFTLQIPAVQIWVKQQSRRSSSEYFVANRYIDLAHMASRCAVDPELYLPGYKAVQNEST